MTFVECSTSVVNVFFSNNSVTITIVGRVIQVNGKRVKLTAQETDFLLFLASGNGQVRTKQMLFRGLYPHYRDIDAKIFDVLACKIRTKLSVVDKNASTALKTIWGRGYAWGEPERNPVLITKTSLPMDQRWTPSRKARVIEALIRFEVTAAEVLDCYTDLSAEELVEWREGYRLGHKGLRTTRISPKNCYRHAA